MKVITVKALLEGYKPWATDPRYRLVGAAYRKGYVASKPPARTFVRDNVAAFRAELRKTRQAFIKRA